ncbi:sensor histidine kinase, partial [Rhodobacteraceae bacterium]|nr:sensor histidine kinase [Paracoccaceae bacterium]
MANIGTDMIVNHPRSSWIRMRTMILIRWMAIFGQSIALFASIRVFDLMINIPLCMFAIGMSVVGNLIATLVYPETKRLSEFENMAMILFDLVQLALLLFATGGLNNPFSVLMMAPV